MVNPSLNPQPEAPSSKRAGGNDMVNPSLNPQPEVPSRRLDRDGATVSPVPMPDPPSPNLENNAPENFTGAAGQGSNRAFDPQSQYTGVWQSQDAATVDNDMNNAGARSATVAQPVGQSTGRLTGPVAPGGSESTAMSTPWERSVMTCIPVPGKGSAVAGMPSYDIWAQNTSSSVIASGQTVYWRLYGATVPSSKFAGTSTDWTEDGTYDLQNTIAVGAKVKVASAYVRGNVSGCETWAQ
jgi:hypothetical protein